MRTFTNEPRVWAACPHCYNSGKLVGKWVDCTEAYLVTIEDLHEGFNKKEDGCEEILCFDYENLPIKGEINLGEAEEWGACYEELGDDDQWPALCAWVEAGCCARDSIPDISDFEEAFEGHWPDFEEYAMNLTENVGLTNGWPEEAVRYFDWDAWTRDLSFDYTVLDAPDGGVYVFNNH